jgi:hypothetical protein
MLTVTQEQRENARRLGKSANDFAREVGCEFQQVVFQDMDVAHGVCRITKWRLPREAVKARYDHFLLLVEYSDGSFSEFIDVNGTTWDARKASVAKLARAAS